MTQLTSYDSFVLAQALSGRAPALPTFDLTGMTFSDRGAGAERTTSVTFSFAQPSASVRSGMDYFNSAMPSGGMIAARFLDNMIRDATRRQVASIVGSLLQDPFAAQALGLGYPGVANAMMNGFFSNFLGTDSSDDSLLGDSFFDSLMRPYDPLSALFTAASLSQLLAALGGRGGDPFGGSRPCEPDVKTSGDVADLEVGDRLAGGYEVIGKDDASVTLRKGDMDTRVSTREGGNAFTWKDSRGDGRADLVGGGSARVDDKGELQDAMDAKGRPMDARAAKAFYLAGGWGDPHFVATKATQSQDVALSGQRDTTSNADGASDVETVGLDLTRRTTSGPVVKADFTKDVAIQGAGDLFEISTTPKEGNVAWVDGVTLGNALSFSGAHDGKLTFKAGDLIADAGTVKVDATKNFSGITDAA